MPVREAVHTTAGPRVTINLPSLSPLLARLPSPIASRFVRQTADYEYRGAGKLKRVVGDRVMPSDIRMETIVRLRRGWTQVEATSTLTRPPSLTGTFSMRSATGAMRILLFDSGDKLIYESPATMVSVGPGLQEGNVILNVSPPQPAAFEARRVGVIHHNTDIPPEQIPLYVALDDQSIPTFMQFNPRTWTMQSLVSDVPQLSFAFSERVA